jgi:uncharacterized protein (TIGR02246 family)
MNRLFCVIPLVCLLCFTFGCQDNVVGTEDEEQITQAINAKMDELINAVKAMDISRILNAYSNDVTAIDQAAITSSPDEFRANYRAALQMFAEVEKCQLVNQHVRVLSDNVAVFFSKIEQRLVLASGEKVDSPGAMTAVFYYSDGDWKIIHLHSSHPTPET